MVIAILLLPRIQKFKVGTLELEKAQSPDVSVDTAQIFNPVLQVVSPSVEATPMLIVYDTPFAMPVKYDVERYFIEIDYERRMPGKILHI